jgi:hypothetical protein
MKHLLTIRDVNFLVTLNHFSLPFFFVHTNYLEAKDHNEILRSHLKRIEHCKKSVLKIQEYIREGANL